MLRFNPCIQATVYSTQTWLGKSWQVASSNNMLCSIITSLIKTLWRFIHLLLLSVLVLLHIYIITIPYFSVDDVSSKIISFVQNLHKFDSGVFCMLTITTQGGIVLKSIALWLSPVTLQWIIIKYIHYK